MKIQINKKILEKNEDCAAANRKFLKDKNILCINMISSPGSGKTTTLEKTINMLKGKVNIAVIVGDLQTELDASRIRATGAQAIQIETKGACHLSAAQVTNAIHTLDTDQIDIIIIENVGNLVCPSDFDLGEEKRVVLLSIAEGDDKCAKYPKAFAKADALLINKIDLLPHLDFDIEKAKQDALKLKKDLKIFEISAKTGARFEDWLNWLTEQKIV